MWRALFFVTCLATFHVAISVDTPYIERQEKVLDLLGGIGEDRKDTDWWKIGNEYNVEANMDNYTNENAAEEFLLSYRSGFMSKDEVFSVYDVIIDNSLHHLMMMERVVVLFKLLYYAKDFETFYKTAAFARVHINDGQFLYAFYIATYQRPDTNTLVIPAPYEMFPQYFVNSETFLEVYHTVVSSLSLS